MTRSKLNSLFGVALHGMALHGAALHGASVRVYKYFFFGGGGVPAAFLVCACIISMCRFFCGVFRQF